LSNAFDLSSMAVLEKLGIDPSKYGTLAYAKKGEEYTASQKIGEAAHFLAADGILVPNARWKCSNAVLFTSRIPPSDISVRKSHGIVDLQDWAQRTVLAN
jgi:RES domain